MLGVLLVVAAVGLRVGISADLGMLLLAAAFQLLTIPVAAHMVGRAVSSKEAVRSSRLAIDELGEPHEIAADK